MESKALQPDPTLQLIHFDHDPPNFIIAAKWIERIHANDVPKDIDTRKIRNSGVELGGKRCWRWVSNMDIHNHTDVIAESSKMEVSKMPKKPNMPNRSSW